MMIPGTVYRIIRPIGQGGMGEVYEVEHDMLGARRALKVLMKHYAGREDLAERLRVEARGLARLKHVNLVEVYDLGTASDGRIFFAMELLDGVTLRELLRHRGRLSVRASVELAAQVLDGLQAAHAAGILHRDVKPENVFVCRGGTVKLLDFGVAKAIDAWMPDQQITGAGMTVGTPRYMAPEQAEGGPVDARTDIYAAGQMVWEMVAGRSAFDETDPYDLAHAKRVRGITPLSQVAGVTASLALSDAVERACEIEAARRFPTAAAFGAALRAAIGMPMVAVPTPGSPPSSVAGLASTTKKFVLDEPGPADGPEAPATRPAATLTRDVQRELTERMESLRSVDRDAPTEAQVVSARAVGPGGTELLPAVVAQRSTPQPVPAVEVPPAPTALVQARKRETSLRPAGRGPLGVPMSSWWAGAAAFVLPLLLAGVIGYWRLSRGNDAGATHGSSSVEPMTSAAAPPGLAKPEAATLIDQDCGVSGSDAALDASDSQGTDSGTKQLVRAESTPAATAPSAVVPAPPTRTATAPPARTATAPPARTATAPPVRTTPPVSTPAEAPPAPTPTKKMPSSGL